MNLSHFFILVKSFKSQSCESLKKKLTAATHNRLTRFISESEFVDYKGKILSYSYEQINLFKPSFL